MHASLHERWNVPGVLEALAPKLYLHQEMRKRCEEEKQLVAGELTAAIATMDRQLGRINQIMQV